MIGFVSISPYDFNFYFRDWQAPVITSNDIPFIGNAFLNADYFLAFDVAHDSPYAPEESQGQWKQLEPILLQRRYITLYKSKDFSDIGITAKIFKRI